jgi:hypothetical protein
MRYRDENFDDDETQPVRDELADAIDRVEELMRIVEQLETELCMSRAREEKAQRLLNGLRLLLA